MKSLSRIVWAEGMHLAQHHFQVQSRYFENLSNFAVNALFFRPYGILACELNTEALLNGTVALVHARGLMPDGLPFHFPEDETPDPIEIRTRFSPTQDRQLLLLGIPPYRPQKSNCVVEATTNHQNTRYVGTAEVVLDETTGQDQKEVALARKNFRLLLSSDAGDTDMVTLPLARIRRDGAGHFAYDETYIPPCTQISASPRLVQLLARLVQILETKAEGLRSERGLVQADTAHYSRGEIAGFWLSHAIHSALGPLHHLLHARTAHPETLYGEMARLAGALCTFAMDAQPQDLPAYDHDALDQVFDALDAHIRGHLEVVMPVSAIRIALRQVEPFLYTGAVSDRRCFGRAHWYLGVRSSGRQADIIERVPQLVKICSARHIVRLVQEQMPGLRLEHVPSPPGAISPRIGTHYFSVRAAENEPCWKAIVDTAQVGVYVPGAVADAELELAVLPPS